MKESYFGFSATFHCGDIVEVVDIRNRGIQVKSRIHRDYRDISLTSDKTCVAEATVQRNALTPLIEKSAPWSKIEPLDFDRNKYHQTNPMPLDMKKALVLDGGMEALLHYEIDIVKGIPNIANGAYRAVVATQYTLGNQLLPAGTKVIVTAEPEKKRSGKIRTDNG